MAGAGERPSGRVCVITGVGPGTGAALTRRFAEGGYRVAMLARDAERLRALEADIPGASAFPTDVSDIDALPEAYARVRRRLGPASVLIHNAVAGAFGTFMETTPEVLAHTFRVNTLALLALGQAVVPDMLAAGAGAVLVTGNTSALRGKATFAGFAPSKAAQRILAQSMARSLGPQGIHVAYIVVDAVIDVPWTRQMFADRPDDFFARPQAIAETAYHIAHQDRSAWTFDVDLRPFAEPW